MNYRKLPTRKLDSLCKRRKLFFLAILNTPKYKNRENAIHETWLAKFPRKIADFAFIRSKIFENESNVVWLKGVNDEEYPPQKKSFRLLNYFYKNLNYDWFVRMAWVFKSINGPKFTVTRNTGT